MQIFRTYKQYFMAIFSDIIILRDRKNAAMFICLYYATTKALNGDS